MNIKEMIDKTGIVIVGLVKTVNEYVSDKKVSYWSVDVECKGTRLPVNIKLPHNFDRSKFKEYELVKVQCCMKPSFDRKSNDLEAIAAFSGPSVNATA